MAKVEKQMNVDDHIRMDVALRIRVGQRTFGVSDFPWGGGQENVERVLGSIFELRREAAIHCGRCGEFLALAPGKDVEATMARLAGGRTECDCLESRGSPVVREHQYRSAPRPNDDDGQIDPLAYLREGPFPLGTVILIEILRGTREVHLASVGGTKWVVYAASGRDPQGLRIRIDEVGPTGDTVSLWEGPIRRCKTGFEALITSVRALYLRIARGPAVT